MVENNRIDGDILIKQKVIVQEFALLWKLENSTFLVSSWTSTFVLKKEGNM